MRCSRSKEVLLPLILGVKSNPPRTYFQDYKTRVNLNIPICPSLAVEYFFICPAAQVSRFIARCTHVLVSILLMTAKKMMILQDPYEVGTFSRPYGARPSDEFALASNQAKLKHNKNDGEITEVKDGCVLTFHAGLRGRCSFNRSYFAQG
jgi:hypothetical protein